MASPIYNRLMRSLVEQNSTEIGDIKDNYYGDGELEQMLQSEEDNVSKFIHFNLHQM